MSVSPLEVGNPAPWFTAPTSSKPLFHFDTVAGRCVVLCFFRSAADPVSRAVLEGVLRERKRFDDVECTFFGVSTDPADREKNRVADSIPGIRYFWDFDRKVSAAYGADPGEALRKFLPHTLVLDERLRVAASIPFGDSAEAHLRQVFAAIDALPPLEAEQPAAVQAPVLLLPRLFEPEFCRTLIEYYESLGGIESGFMRDIEGRTVLVMDASHKRRRDQEIQDANLRREIMIRIHDRLVPEIRKAFQFNATRIERYIVACYDAAEGGHFRAHRDNTTKGTAHRRFAVSINLNTEEFSGGGLRFPEFGRRIYTPPTGGCVVFSCSLLHEAMPVTRGRRYAVLPFLYDEAAAEIRKRNEQFLDLERPQT